MLTGPIINGILIFAGTFVGMLLNKNISDRLQDAVIKALGLVVVYLAYTSLRPSVSGMNVLISLSLGSAIGEILDLDGKIVAMGEKLKERLARNDPHFVNGFVQACLIFCVGSMAIIGALESGLQKNHTTLITKGVIDGITAIFFAARNGIGVLFSGFAVLFYEGAMALLASLLSSVMTQGCLDSIGTVGGLILLTVGLNMASISKFKSMNMVPAIIITVILTLMGI